jgi:hypothetical protein
MVKLKLEQCLRIMRSQPTRIACITGVVWVTQQGDCRDYIVARDEVLDVKGGLTLITALEPSVLDVQKMGASLCLRRVRQWRTAAAAWLKRWAGAGRVGGRVSPLPYY